MTSADYGAIFYDDVVSKDPGDYGAVFYESQPLQENGEPFWKKAARTALQVPQGIAEGTVPGLVSSGIQFLGMGADLDPEEFHNVRRAFEEKGEQFDEDAYRQAAQESLQYYPTVANIARKVEEMTGIPLEPKEWYQKALRLGSLAGKAVPGTAIQKGTAGVAAPAMNELLQQAGLPEQFSEPLSLAFAGIAGANAPAIEASLTKEKPSGLSARQFEKLEKPRTISPEKIGAISDKLESDFRGISDRIISKSPIGETANNLRNDPTFKQQSRELMNQAQVIADQIQEPISSGTIKKELADLAGKKVKGYSLGEYDKNYLKFMKESIADVLPEKVTAGELVEQYRKNNASLGEYFEPGASKALNRAKKDALLDQNRAITQVMKKSFPESELVPVFEEGNARWSKIKDVEAIDEFIGDVFKKDGVNHRKLNELFDDPYYERIFKRALGDKGYADFQQLTKDMLTSEKGYKMLRAARDQGYKDLAQTGLAYVMHPKLGAGKFGLDLVKGTYRTLMNYMLDKPQIGLTFKRAAQELKKGNFAAADKEFKILEAEILPAEEVPKTAAKFSETIEATPEPISKPPPEIKQITEVRSEPQKTAPKEIGSSPEAKQLEYIPKEIPKPKQPTIHSGIFRDAIEGKPISPKQKEVLRRTNVALLQTRGKGQQFHGTRKPIQKLNSEIYDVSGEQNIFGAGFYTTDALDIADGYSKAKRSKTPTVYKVNEKTPQRLYDTEIPMSKEIREKLNYYIEEYGDAKTVKEIYDNITENGEGLPTYEVQETLNGVSSSLQNLGYDGITHKGGLLTNNPEHYVKIYWKPENLEIQEFSYPASFKKISKTANPPELPATPTKTEKPPEKKARSQSKKSYPAEPAKSMTEEKVNEIKRQDITSKGLKSQKHWLVEQLDEAIANAPEIDIPNPVKKKNQNWAEYQKDVQKYNHKQDQLKDLLTFEVPGDGEFKIKNHKKALKQFRDSVEKKWPERATPPAPQKTHKHPSR